MRDNSGKSKGCILHMTKESHCREGLSCFIFIPKLISKARKCTLAPRGSFPTAKRAGASSCSARLMLVERLVNGWCGDGSMREKEFSSNGLCHYTTAILHPFLLLLAPKAISNFMDCLQGRGAIFFY
jgi:hypothetical protein